MQYAEENRHPLTTEPASQVRAAAAALQVTRSLTFIIVEKHVKMHMHRRQNKHVRH